jgi:cyclopropane-fatty-acyl-phospholipid synthase
MVYSCGYFSDWNNDLATAQRDKLDMICRKLRLQPGESLLDIGCGWGALVCHAARHFGVRAHGVTLAEEQFAYAKEKVARLGLADKVTLELRDHKAVEGSFDKIASIGMFEHVGEANHRAYFQSVNRLLKPGGLYLHHSIALRAPAYERFRRGRGRDRAAAGAIGRYIFPGGELDHLGMSITNLELNGFEVHDVEAWREHYARTTRLWHDRLAANCAAAEREVGSEKTRLWIAYLAVVSIAFAQGTVGIFQTLASRRVRGPSGVPPTRADLYR